MRGLFLHRDSSRVLFLTLSFVLAGACGSLPAARATFHLNEINKIMTSHDGDVAVQAIELKMIANGEHLVNGVSVVAEYAKGVQVDNLGTFGANLSATGSVAGAKILLATMKWRQRFGVTPDLQISPGLLPTNGQIAIQTATCIVNAVAYGNVSTFIGGGVSAAPPLPTQGAPYLIRFIENTIAPSCPMAEDAERKFQFKTASASFPTTFTNYSGIT